MSDSYYYCFPSKKRKGYFRLIQRIVEFYMSDGNLRRDKYLRSRMDEYMEVKSTVFLSCHRIRLLKANLHDIFIALKPSRFLEATHTTVKRRFPIQEKSKEDVDKCSIYVERLPPDITHELLSQIFTYFGKVNIVTIPRYQSNRKIKGYGFIEFEEESSCKAALEKFASFGGVLGEDCSACNKLHSIENDSNEAENEPQKEEEIIPEDPEPDSSIHEEYTLVPEPKVVPSEKRKRRRKRKRWMKVKNFACYGLQIMSMSSWNQLRHRYLCIQAANRRILKAQIAKVRKPAIQHEKLITITPKTVFAISLPNPITEVDVKALKLIHFIEYVDYEPGSETGYIRTSCPESAAWFLRHSTEYFPNMKIEPLSMEDEYAYMEKIDKDRALLKKRKAKGNVSGVKKILKRAESVFASC